MCMFLCPASTTCRSITASRCHPGSDTIKCDRWQVGGETLVKSGWDKTRLCIGLPLAMVMLYMLLLNLVVE